MSADIKNFDTKLRSKRAMKAAQKNPYEQLESKNRHLEEQIKHFEIENQHLKGHIGQLKDEVTCLNEQIEWFRRQIFGKRSERIIEQSDEYQMTFKGFEDLHEKKSSPIIQDASQIETDRTPF